MSDFVKFNKSLFTFLKELEDNNNRDWFNANKTRYQELVQEPGLDFIRAMAPVIEQISPHFRADARKSGGSMMRIYRDTRFGKDKTPYKTNLGIQFRHEDGKDIHAPGFYLHLANDGCWIGIGMWVPPKDPLLKIRQRIRDEPKVYKKVINAKKFKDTYELGGESLKTYPRGFSPDDPMIEHLRKKSFIASTKLTKTEVTGKDFLKTVTTHFKTAVPYNKFLAETIGVSF